MNHDDVCYEGYSTILPPATLVDADRAWARYVDESPEGSESKLYEKLAILSRTEPGFVVAQNPQLDTVEALLAASQKYNDTVHAYLQGIMDECGAEVGA